MLTLFLLSLICKPDTSITSNVTHYVYEENLCSFTYSIIIQDDLQLYDNGTYMLQHFNHKTAIGSMPPVTREYGIYKSHNDTLELKSAIEGGNRILTYCWEKSNTCLKPIGSTVGYTLVKMDYWTNQYLPEKKIKIDTYYQGHL